MNLIEEVHSVHRETRTSTKIWAGIVILGILILGGLSISGNGKSEAAKRAARSADLNTQISQQNIARTECIREISNSLDHGFRFLIGKEFQLIKEPDSQDRTIAIGAQIAALPKPQDVANHGGVILGERFDPCPPAPTSRTSPSSPTSP